MKSIILRSTLCTLLAALCLTAACSKSDSGETNRLLSIALSSSSLSLTAGGTATLTATATPATASLDALQWTSTDPKIATVTDGVVTAVAAGSTTVTATCGTFNASCNVTVGTGKYTFSFFQLNLWEGLSNVSGGQQALVNQLVTLAPDAASFCEFRTSTEAETILKAAATALTKSTGTQYYYSYLSGSGTRGLLSRYPIISTSAVSGTEWFFRTIINFHGQQIALYASHSYYSYYACYLPRGYGDGESPYGWNKISTGPVTDVTYILQREELSGRSDIAKTLLADVSTQKQAGRLAIFGGDLNQPSHLDWIEATKDRMQHNGCVVAWPISTLCYAGGLRDAFRTVYPDPVTHPGTTWPVYNKNASKDTQWATEADERDRIDYVYYLPDTKIAVSKAQLVGPSAMKVAGKVVEETFVNRSSELITPTNDLWPTDHRGVLITFELDLSK